MAFSLPDERFVDIPGIVQIRWTSDEPLYYRHPVDLYDELAKGQGLDDSYGKKNKQTTEQACFSCLVCECELKSVITLRAHCKGSQHIKKARQKKKEWLHRNAREGAIQRGHEPRPHEPRPHEPTTRPLRPTPAASQHQLDRPRSRFPTAAETYASRPAPTSSRTRDNIRWSPYHRDSMRERSLGANSRSPSPLGRRSPFLNRRSPPVDRRSPPLDRRSPPLIRSSPPLIRRSPALNRRSPRIDRRSSPLYRRSPPFNRRSSPSGRRFSLIDRNSATSDQRSSSVSRSPSPINRNFLASSRLSSSTTRRSLLDNRMPTPDDQQSRSPSPLRQIPSPVDLCSRSPSPAPNNRRLPLVRRSSPKVVSALEWKPLPSDLLVPPRRDQGTLVLVKPKRERDAGEFRLQTVPRPRANHQNQGSPSGMASSRTEAVEDSDVVILRTSGKFSFRDVSALKSETGPTGAAPAPPPGPHQPVDPPQLSAREREARFKRAVADTVKHYLNPFYYVLSQKKIADEQDFENLCRNLSRQLRESIKEGYLLNNNNSLEGLELTLDHRESIRVEIEFALQSRPVIRK